MLFRSYMTKTWGRIPAPWRTSTLLVLAVLAIAMLGTLGRDARFDPNVLNPVSGAAAKMVKAAQQLAQMESDPGRAAAAAAYLQSAQLLASDKTLGTLTGTDIPRLSAHIKSSLDYYTSPI